MGRKARFGRSLKEACSLYSPSYTRTTAVFPLHLKPTNSCRV